MIDIVITSDIRIYCEGLAGILARTHDVNIAGVANNYEDAIVAISANPTDVLLLDMTMAGSCNLAKHISTVNPHIKIVALAVSYDEGNIMLCAEAGVTCYVPREASVNELIEAIKEAAKGECYCPPKIAACILKKVQSLTLSAKNKYLSSSTSESQLPDRGSAGRQTGLTPRERQIADLLAEGLSNKQIARDLSIEVSTVKNHVHNVLVKLEVKNRGQAVFSLRNKLPYAESFDLDPYLNISS
jgi:two-component system nitrate/nitrite response regulator NarL